MRTDKIVQQESRGHFKAFVYSKMPVIENVMTSMNMKMHYGIATSILRLPRFGTRRSGAEDRAMEILEIFGMESFAEVYAENLPYGLQRKLEIARALATDRSCSFWTSLRRA